MAEGESADRNNDDIVRGLSKSKVDRTPPSQSGESVSREERPEAGVDTLIPNEKRELTARDDLKPEVSKRIGEAIATALLNRNYHPVVIFGASNAGKTMLVLSLITCDRLENGDPAFTLSFDPDPVYPLHELYGKDVADSAKDTVHSDGPYFREGILPDSTRAVQPFFIPVILTRTDTREEIRLAFLDSRGEHYVPDMVKTMMSASGDGNARETREKIVRRGFPEIINVVLAQFMRPISIIYVAPNEFKDETEKNYSRWAIEGSVDNYDKVRNGQQIPLDRHLWLLSKWDTAIDRHDSYGKRLFVATADDVRKKIEDKYGSAWTAFSARARSGPAPSHYFMQYTVGVVNRDRIENLTPEMHLKVRRYARTILNYLWRNAVEARTGSGSSRINGSPPLFPDVVPVPPTILDRIMGMLGIQSGP